MRLVATLFVALVTALAGCAANKPTGPAWPAPSKTAEDGGESVAPRSTSIAAAVEKSPDDSKPSTDAADDAKPAEAAGESEDPATLSSPTPPSDDDVFISDEIFIEIEED